MCEYARLVPLLLVKLQGLLEHKVPHRSEGGPRRIHVGVGLLQAPYGVADLMFE